MVQILNNKKQVLGRSGMVSKIILSIVLIVFFFPAFSKEYKINPSASSLQWEAKKVTGQLFSWG